MRNNFSKGVNILFDLEGYKSDNPNDKGGLTKYGIAQAYHPDIDVANLTLDQAKEIYLKEYWIPLGCDDREYPFDVVLFVQGVNMWLRAKTYLDQSHGLLDFFMLNLNYYASRSSDQRKAFLTGWCNRLIKLYHAIK
jgi:lysozyme family protein